MVSVITGPGLGSMPTSLNFEGVFDGTKVNI
jgi:hypothetical protein